MFFAWVIKCKYPWLSRSMRWGEPVIIIGLTYGLAYALMRLVKWLILASGSEVMLHGFDLASRPVLFLVMVGLAVFLLDRLFRYRTGDMVILTLSICSEDISLNGLHLRRGMVIPEMRLGEVYNYAKYWRLRLKPSELAPFIFLDAYQGALKLIEEVKAGRAPIDRTTPLTTTTIFLHTVREATGRNLPIYVAEEAKREKTLLYRLAIALSLRMNPFSAQIPDPGSGSKRVYFTTQTFLEMEDFFRQEADKLSRLTNRILKRKQPASNRNTPAPDA